MPSVFVVRERDPYFPDQSHIRMYASSKAKGAAYFVRAEEGWVAEKIPRFNVTRYHRSWTKPDAWLYEIVELPLDAPL